VPAAAVIPAPIAYIKVVAVKKLVVEPLAWARFGRGGNPEARPTPSSRRSGPAVHSAGPPAAASVTVNKLECLKQACRLNTLAWNNEMDSGAISLVALRGND
jgi:hypothetical protein